MPKTKLPLSKRIILSIKGHLRVGMIALAFGMTAYGFVHLLRWAIDYGEHF